MMSPAGWRHGGVAANVASFLGPFIRTNDLGRGFGAETGFLLRRDPDTVRAPDFAFIAKKHLPNAEPQDAFWPGAPIWQSRCFHPTTGRERWMTKYESGLAPDARRCGLSIQSCERSPSISL